MVALVERMLDLNKRLPGARTDQEQTFIKRQIAVTDKEIDELVYELYGLTEEERKIVGGVGNEKEQEVSQTNRIGRNPHLTSRPGKDV